MTLISTKIKIECAITSKSDNMGMLKYALR